MKKKILYAITTAVIATTAFFVGKNFTEPTQQPETVQAETIQTMPELTEMTVENGGLYLEYSDGKSFFTHWVPTEDLEKAGLIDTANIIDWNTNGKELAVITENDYEWYAYKSADVYQNRAFIKKKK